MSLRFSLSQARKMGVSEDVLKSLPRASRGRAPSRGSPVQEALWAAVSARWPHAVEDYNKAIPGRKFEIDIAFVDERVALEVDGWQFHGKFLTDFKRDREKDKLLTLEGWRILRFTAEEIRMDINACLEQVSRVLEL